MQRAPAIFMLPLAGLLAACTVSTSTSPTEAVATPAETALASSDSELLARGEYLVRIAGCNDCHTAGYGQRGGDVPQQDWLLGSAQGYHGPWGTTYASNLRLTAAGMDEAGWLKYTGELHTRPIMPDFSVRAMQEDDRRAIYRFLRKLGPAGNKAPEYLPPGQTPPAPYFQLVLPPGPPPKPG